MMTHGKTIALIPVRGTTDGKQRLAACLPMRHRSRLIQLMLADLLTALRAVPGIDAIWIVSADERLAAHGDVHIDYVDRGLNTELAYASRQAAALADTVLIFSADLPLANTADITSLLAAARSNKVVVVPDRHGKGTNALAMSPPSAMLPSFGVDSRRRHEHAAHALDLTLCTLQLNSLSHDVDVPEDIDAVVRARPDRYGFLRGALAQTAP